jgi:acyl dehydratase
MKFENLAAFKEAVGKTFTSPDWFHVTQDKVDAFAEATQDFQWIHTDSEQTRQFSPFGGPIAHGFYSLSLISKFISDTITIDSAKMGVNYGLNKVRFPHAVPMGSKLRCHFEILLIEAYEPNGVKVTWGCSVEIEGNEKPACVAEMISLMFE